MQENILNNYLIENLKKLDFSFDESNLPEIVFLNNVPDNLHPKHYLALEFAEIFKVDAIYFRYYDDSRFCVPQVYFYDNTLTERTQNDIAEIHKRVYSSCQVPLICFLDNTNITLFDCRIPVKPTPNGISNKDCVFKIESLDNLEVLNQYFSAKHLNYGLFWESEETSNNFLNNKSAYEKLVVELSKIRTNFINVFAKNDIDKGFADDLLFKCILIKYLEENGKDGINDFARDFYQRSNLQANSLFEILNGGGLIKLLNCLERQFNGGVFEIENPAQLELLNNSNLSILAEHLEGRLSSNNQVELWNIYSFKDIPIELISNFYEEFIPKTDDNKGTVYTPSFLVNLLIDECLPLSNKEEDKNYNVKLIDVSCGSGIFITSAFKRLIQRWRVAKGENGQPKAKETIKLTDVKQILSKNIFGVDKNETAVKLTKFSLQLALCQIVPNNELWNWSDEKVFDDLNENIYQRDFFDFLIEKKNLHNSFDLVIGNPPFELLPMSKYDDYCIKLKEIGFKFKIQIPKYQIALMFLEVSNILLKPKANLCFIQKSTSLLYNKSEKAKKFRDHIFSSFNVYQILDFTLLKNVLFKNAEVETCAVFYKKEQIESYSTNHIVSRLLKSTKDGLLFEFDYYDFHEISKEKVITDENIWRSNLLGGNRLYTLVQYLGEETLEKTSLKEYIKQNLRLETDRYRNGFQFANGELSADFITNKRILLGKDFNKKGRKFSKLNLETKFYLTNKEVLYTEPSINIKRIIENNQLYLAFNDIDTAFNETIVGISAPKSKRYELEQLFNILQKNQRIFSLQTLATCSQFYLGTTSAIQKQDIDKWPIPLNGDEIKLSIDEKIILDDTLDYIYPSWYLGEKALIHSIIANIEKDNTFLSDYSETYLRSINSIYKQEGKELKLKRIIEGKVFFACEFYYTNESVETKFEYSDLELDNLLKEQIGTNTVYNKILRLYHNNDTITFVKPKNLRYWLKSVALRDADDTFDDIIANGM